MDHIRKLLICLYIIGANIYTILYKSTGTLRIRDGPSGYTYKFLTAIHRKFRVFGDYTLSDIGIFYFHAQVVFFHTKIHREKVNASRSISHKLSFPCDDDDDQYCIPFHPTERPSRTIAWLCSKYVP
jgi:hypothetical protein